MGFMAHGSCCNLALGGITNRGGAGLKPSAGRLVSRERSAASGDVRDPPPCSQSIVLYRMQFAEKISRLMSPFSKDETGHES